MHAGTDEMVLVHVCL